MTRLRLLLLVGTLLVVSACAHTHPPIVQQWRALLVDRSGLSVVHRTVGP